ncbi:hemolysin family protein [Plantactinospora soyae]|uniref:Hemolysin n=1 Tax=Plantactinospora soyae TaxID=1544732 RepID=A0A927R4W1_9ACTN|nr:hemolysin family protein [Plantactinospora soyae]MBE1486914.1 putative hemolysin [Plantactinospora soyae]
MRESGSTGPRRRSPGHPRRDPGPLARALARIVVRAADGATRLVTALLGASPTAGREQISEAELRDLVAVNTRLDPVERGIIDEVLEAGASLVREVMMPRTEVVFLAAGLTLRQAAQLVRAETHTRYPVVDGTHDDVIGFVHLRDVLLRPDGDACTTIGELTREVKKVPGSKRVLAALTEMRRERHHLAVVVDEYGGTAGIVTLEDLIEELVGEIHDEYDTDPDPVLTGGPIEVDGRLNLADFAERAGFALPPGPYETVGGFVMAALGRLPVRGDEVAVPGMEDPTASGAARGGAGPDDPLPPGGWLLRVLAVQGRRVARVGISVGRLPEQRTSVSVGDTGRADRGAARVAAEPEGGPAGQVS